LTIVLRAGKFVPVDVVVIRLRPVTHASVSPPIEGNYHRAQ